MVRFSLITDLHVPYSEHLSAPTPTWKYYDDTKLNSAYTSAQSLNPKGWTSTAAITDTSSVDSSVKLVGVLTGDVDGSWVGV